MATRTPHRIWASREVSAELETKAARKPSAVDARAWRFEDIDLSEWYEYALICGSFRKLGVPYFGVLIIRILIFRVLYEGPLFSETPM